MTGLRIIGPYFQILYTEIGNKVKIQVLLQITIGIITIQERDIVIKQFCEIQKIKYKLNTDTQLMFVRVESL